MKLASKIELTRPQVEEIILAHLRASDKHGLKYDKVEFNVSAGGRGGYMDQEYESPSLTKATVYVEMELS